LRADHPEPALIVLDPELFHLVDEFLPGDLAGLELGLQGIESVEDSLKVFSMVIRSPSRASPSQLV